MKKISLLISFVMTVVACLAQGYTYTPWQPSMGSITFNTLGDAQHPYVQCKTSSNWQNPVNVITPNNMALSNPSTTATTHAIITSNMDDPCRCYQLGNSSNYPHERYLPPSWENGSYEIEDLQDTVIRIGCGVNNNTCNKAAQIEYWLYPEEENSTLLVMFSFALINAYTGGSYGHGSIVTSNGGCASITNPQFFIEVFDGETGQLLNLGYYPTQASQGTANPVPNTNWPYSRFLAWPSGCSAGGDFVSLPDNTGTKTYYWAGQTNSNGSSDANGYATPTTFAYRECPSNYTGGTSGSYPVLWFDYKPLAFNLKTVAAQNVDANGNFVANKSIKLRIRTVGCSATAHWAYGLFTAKMIPGVMQVDACGDQPVHLSVPWGFNENTYVWHYGYDSADATNKYWDLSEPIEGVTPEGQNGVYVTDQNLLYPYYRCEMKSYTGVPFIYEAHIKNYYIRPNFTFEQVYNNCNLTANLIDSSEIYVKIPPTQQGGLPEYIYQETQNIKWYVKKLTTNNYIYIGNNPEGYTYTFDSTTITPDGQATIKIVVQDEEFKCIDSIEKTIQLDMSAIEKVYTQDTIKTCEQKLPVVYDPAYFGEDQTWSTEGTRRVNYQGLAWNGCDSLVDVTLMIRKPKVDIVFDLDFCDEFTTTLAASTDEDVAEYKWSTGENTPSIVITTPGTYSLDIVSEDGCTCSNNITIPACKPFLNLANSISPSVQDGINDYFTIPQTSLIQSLEFTVFNRFGEIIYHTTNKDFAWNGTEKGKLFVHATYTYILRITDYEGVTSTHKGSITIL